MNKQIIICRGYHCFDEPINHTVEIPFTDTDNLTGWKLVANNEFQFSPQCKFVWLCPDCAKRYYKEHPTKSKCDICGGILYSGELHEISANVMCDKCYEIAINRLLKFIATLTYQKKDKD